MNELLWALSCLIWLATGFIAGRTYCIVKGHNGWRKIAEDWRRLCKCDGK